MKLSSICRLISFFLLPSAVCCLLSLSGCNSGPALPSDLPKLTPCALTFTQEGQPLDGAMVTLNPTDGSKWYPSGITDEKGTVELYTNGKYKGAPKGKYKVVVKKIYTEPSKLGPPVEEGAPGYEEWQQKASKEKRGSWSVVEKSFTNVDTTTLEVDIPAAAATYDLGKAAKDIFADE
ncbi:MAG: hypothetical protein FWE67_08900 [Planctomycetaceae bacterium]|nr:hypothetical protein [Planctomycetaceae bacterium]